MRAGKGQVEVLCGPKEGLFDQTQRAIRCACEECRGASAGWVSLAEFERHGGKASNRKPKASIRIKSSGDTLGKWLAQHAEVRPSQRGRGSQPLAPSAATAAASGSDTEDSDRLGVLLEAARQRQLLGTPMASADGRDDGPRRSSSGASSSQAGLEGLKAGRGASPPPSQGQVAAAMAAAGGAARQLSSSSSEESSSSGESSEDSGESSSKDGSSGSEGAQQARDASPAAPVLPALGRKRAPGTAAADPGSPGSTEGEGGPDGSARRVLPRRAAAPTAGFGTQLHIHPPPATNKEVAARQKRGRDSKPPAGRHKRQRDGKAKGGEEAAPAKRPKGRPPQARQQAQQGREPPANRPPGRAQPAPQPAPRPASQQGLLLRCTSLKLLKDLDGRQHGMELSLVVPTGGSPSTSGGSGGGGGDDSVTLLERVAEAAEDLGMSLEGFSVGESSEQGTPLELQLWVQPATMAPSAAPRMGARPAQMTPQLAIALIKRLSST
ncbi:hypothetical protein ABPG77_000238 [Micractinium sp. CCAP 211/92]